LGKCSRGEEPVTTHKESTMANTDDLKGRAKEAVGDLTNDEDLQREGKADRAAGAVKEKADEVKDKIGDAVDAVKDKLHRS
jgi:uncharacterized protein YjbJ (UPF0337 family)